MSDTKLLAKDLRIGNLHYYRMADDFDDRKEWTEISVIDANDILFLSENPDDENYSPIPLSEDVLVKLGFEKTKWINCYILNNVDVFFTRVEHDNSLHLDDFPHINSAHRLQNHYYENTNQELIYTP